MVTWPELPHETNIEFISSLKEQLIQSGFLWPQENTHSLQSVGAARIPITGNLNHTSRQPDMALCFAGNEIPWLVSEVANSQSWKRVYDKVWDYCIGTRGNVRFVMIIKLWKVDNKNKYPNLSRFERIMMPEDSYSVHDIDPTDPSRLVQIAPSDTTLKYTYQSADVSIYKTITPPIEDGRRVLDFEPVFEHQQVWPTWPEFVWTIRTRDINYEPGEIPLGHTEDEFHIRFHWLYNRMATLVSPKRPDPRIWSESIRKTTHSL
ncbi:hypothetical protein K440DRAFT_255560 [Wilcoxina mikolae CBS 423.85]|nr:hypothetical protein K440DRAFT_308551 [Wilcoxina mikolae CBS 423.85]KAF8241470.1 hypothetical protein K440DRAFT_255560 [Wilcoxina mikolae CBS 423.85]